MLGFFLINKTAKPPYEQGTPLTLIHNKQKTTLIILQLLIPQLLRKLLN
jgi:hypothetical protein